MAFIVAIHNVLDPDRFWGATADPSAQLPPDVRLHSTYPQAGGAKAVCLWEAESTDRVRELVEAVAGDASRNEFFEVDPKHPAALGLPA